MKTVKSSCRICINCGFNFDVEDNQIVSFAADLDHPYSEGYCCPKGIAGIELQQGLADRITESRKKTTGNDFITMNAYEGAREAGEKLAALAKEYGPRSIALFYGTGAYHNTLGTIFSKSWLHEVGSPNLFTTVTIDQSSHWVTFGRMGMFLGGERAVNTLDVALLSGNNPMVSHMASPYTPFECMNPGENAKKMRAKGNKLIVVDPRKTETAEYADLHLQVIPGEDATLYAGIIHLLFKNNWVDTEFCDRFAIHVKRLKSMVQSYKPDYVAKRVGVPEGQVREAARMLGNAKRTHAACCTGTAMAPDSNLADFLIECINVLRGGFRRAGEVVSNRTPLASGGAGDGVAVDLGGTVAIEDVLPPARTWESGVKCRTQDVGKISGEFPSALLPDEILQSGEDKIRALVVFGGNPAMSIPDPRKTLTAFKDLDLLITLDHRMTETAELSDYVLATSTQYERHDLSSFGEFLMPETYAQYFRPVVEKPQNVAHDWEIFWEFGRAMGLQLDLRYLTAGVGFETLPPGPSIDMLNRPECRDMLRQICEEKGLSFDELERAPGGIRPDLPELRVVKAEHDSGARLDLCPDDIARDLERVRQQPLNETKYRFVTRRLIAAMNSHYRNSDFARRKFPQNFAYMHPDDIAEEGLTSGATVDITSDSGTIIGVVRSDETLRRGVISMSHCYGTLDPEDDPLGEQGGHTGRLIALDPQRSEAINFMPHMSGFPVTVNARQ